MAFKSEHFDINWSVQELHRSPWLLGQLCVVEGIEWVRIELMKLQGGFPNGAYTVTALPTI